MIHKFDELRKGFSEEQRMRLDSEVKEMSREYVLSQIRNEAGLTQQDVADRMDISQPAYAAYEKAENMRIGTLRKIIAALGGKTLLSPRRLINAPKRTPRFHAARSRRWGL